MSSPHFEHDDTISFSPVPFWEAEDRLSVNCGEAQVIQLPVHESHVAVHGIRKHAQKFVETSRMIDEVSWAVAKAFFTGEQDLS